MANTFPCPTCGTLLEPPDNISLTMLCTNCHAIVTVPEELRNQPAPSKADGKLQEMVQAYPELAPLLGQLTANSGKLREMVELARSGKKLEAIKIYREIFGVGLQEAKDAIEQLQTTGQLNMVQTTAEQPQTTGLSSAQVEEIAQILHRGNKIEAIKRYRQITGAGLKEAKDAVEAIERLPGYLQSGGSGGNMPGTIQATRPTIETAPFPPADIGVGNEKPRSSGAKTFGIIVAGLLILLLVAVGLLAFVLMNGH